MFKCVNRWQCLTSVLLLALLSSGCTTVGVATARRDTIDYGPRLPLRLCLLKAEDVPDQRVQLLTRALREEFAQYGIDVEVPWVRPWERPGFTAETIVKDVLRRDLEPPCDRLMALVDRNPADVLWGLLMPQILGAVDTYSRTRGFIVATVGSISQLTMSPKDVSIHEFYHLLGCNHAVTLNQCYPRIAAIKSKTDPAAGFFAGLDQQGRYLLTREAVKAAIDAGIGGRDR